MLTVCNYQMDVFLLIAGAVVTFVVLQAIIRSDEEIENAWLAQHPIVYTTTTDGKQDLKTRLISNRWL